MPDLKYWRDCISFSVSSCGISLTEDQLNTLVEDIAISHEMYSETHYSPSSSDCCAIIKDESNKKIKSLEKELNEYKNRSEKAVKRILELNPDEKIHINKYGEIEQF